MKSAAAGFSGGFLLQPDKIPAKMRKITSLLGGNPL